jgi:hypothetical protein
MSRIYGEEDVTWASVEKDIAYDKVVWDISNNGIPIYTFMDKEGKIIKVQI